MKRNTGTVLSMSLLAGMLLAGLGTLGFICGGEGEGCQAKKADPAAAAKKDGCCAEGKGKDTTLVAAPAAEGCPASGAGAKKEGGCPHAADQASTAAVAQDGGQEGKPAAKKGACCAEGKAAGAAVALVAVTATGGPDGEDCCEEGGCPLTTLDIARMSRCAEDVKLTGDQKEKFHKLMAGATKKCADIQEKSTAARRSVILAVLNGDGDEDVQAKVDAALNAEARSFEHRVRFLKSFAALLTPEQVKHLQGCASGKKEGGACCEEKKAKAASTAVVEKVAVGHKAANMVTYRCECTGNTWTQAKGEKKFCPTCKESMPDCGTIVSGDAK